MTILGILNAKNRNKNIARKRLLKLQPLIFSLEIDSKLIENPSRFKLRSRVARQLSTRHSHSTRPLTSLFRNMKYIWMKMKAILVAGVRASMML